MQLLRELHCMVTSLWTYYISVGSAGLSRSLWYYWAIVSRGRASPCDWFWPSQTTAISFDGGTDIAQLHWRPLLFCCRCAHLELSSAIRNNVAISVDFSDEIENW